MAYNANLPLSTSPVTVISIDTDATLLTTAASSPAGTLIYVATGVSAGNLYICLPDYSLVEPAYVIKPYILGSQPLVVGP